MVNPSLIVMDSDKTINVTFVEIPTYYIYLTLFGSGAVTYNGSGEYSPGDIVSITATPAVGWEFAGWSGDLTGMVNPSLIVMDSDKTINVTFEETGDHDVEVTNQTVSINEVLPGELVDIYVTVHNDGDYTETFDLACYYDSTLIGTVLIVDLAPTEARKVLFTWDTNGVPLNQYLITAWADSGEVITEVDESNNWCTVSCPIFVVPELPFGTIMAFGAMLAALTLYKKSPRGKHL
jgi:hypothetical protein